MVPFLPYSFCMDACVRRSCYYPLRWTSLFWGIYVILCIVQYSTASRRRLATQQNCHFHRHSVHSAKILAIIIIGTIVYHHGVMDSAASCSVIIVQNCSGEQERVYAVLYSIHDVLLYHGHLTFMYSRVVQYIVSETSLSHTNVLNGI